MRLGIPRVVEANTAEVMLAGEPYGMVEGAMTDEADEVAVGRVYVVE